MAITESSTQPLTEPVTAPQAPTPEPDIPHGLEHRKPPPAVDVTLSALTQLLIDRGQCDPRSIERARRVASENGVLLETALIQLGLVTERGLGEAFSELLKVPIVTPERFPDAPVMADRLKAKFLRRVHALPLAVENGQLAVAMANPLDSFARAAIAAATGLTVTVEVAVPIELEKAFEHLYPESTANSEDGTFDDDAIGDGPGEEDAERLKDMASEAPVVRLVNQIIGRAVETHASDIHIEPFEDRVRLRYRYDGVLQEGESPPASMQAAIISRIKIMSRLDIAERRLPQDGRLKMAVRGQEIDFRVSTIPSLYGETAVLRVLDRTAVSFDYARIGLTENIVAKLKALFELPNGMILVTGPTGSGKTTTLYTGISNLNSVDRKIVTVEDPIEYQLAGINQIQVKPQIGLTFATLLRSILRQDPDVIMVGEIRDLETAQIGVQAALTGHLVLSTLHTNSAAATVTRLRDMGLEDYLITAVLKGVLAQRLVRTLCPDCKHPEIAAPELITRLWLESRTLERPIRIWRPIGCPKCRGTGYRGRIAIAELLVPDEQVERMIFSRADFPALERAAIDAGMKPLFDAGLEAALAGQTSIEEVMRTLHTEA